MYPPKVADTEIRHVIQELTVEGKLPSGATVRAELAQRYKSRGGVARIYRLLAAEASELGRSSPASVAGRLLEQEVRNLREQLQRSREREEAHQAHWSKQVRDLWQRVEVLEPKVNQALANGAVGEEVRQEVREADLKAGRLDVLLRAFGPAPGGAKSSE